MTGGAGSFGHAFTRMLLQGSVGAVRVLSRDEEKHRLMAEAFPDKRLDFLLGDVRDGARLRRAFEGVDVVVHAAALKQIPATEADPVEAVKTNVLGAVNVIEAALDSGVKRVMALSSDKACAPVLLYGATKLCAERLVCAASQLAGPRDIRFACVRYGNVVASRGSVIPKFIEQAKTGRVTLTHPLMTRFWMTLDEAARFVYDRIEDMEDGKVYVPRLPSVRVRDLITAIAPEAQVDITGIRFGEKLHESMVSFDESYRTLHLGDHFAIGRETVNPEAWSYSSDRNTFLSVDEICERLVGLGPL
ncbi:MAG: polysaccharide biosynthesis protein [Gemmatimonadaceae bacterium]|nr:polysaccharide biosynthesis protein [Gemmatimonadaceae bacterium]